MDLRYDFVGDRLDLRPFQKQAKHFISYGMRRLTLFIYCKHFKIQINIDTPDSSNAHIVDFAIMELQRDQDGEIELHSIIPVQMDSRFSSFKEITDHYHQRWDIGSFQSNSAQHTVDVLSKIIKIVFKIANLVAFL